MAHLTLIFACGLTQLQPSFNPAVHDHGEILEGKNITIYVSLHEENFDNQPIHQTQYYIITTSYTL